MFNYKENIENFPETFGVYIMKDKKDNIIYVGKANNLKARIKQYFNGADKRANIIYLRENINDIEYIVTDSEIEALILENNLIKENKPKYNTLLKDDKTYPYIEITLGERYPRILNSKNIKNNKSKYFGPFPNKSSMNNIIKILQKNFFIRSCDFLPKKECLYYHLNQCSAPCINKEIYEEYNHNINKCIDILSGNIKEIINEYSLKMSNASAELNFELASYYRDFINDLNYIVSEQRVSSIKDINDDIIVCEKSKETVIIVLFMVRNGKIIAKHHFYMKDEIDNTNSEILSSFIKQYYNNITILPKNIIIEEQIDDKVLLLQYFQKIKNCKLNIVVPKKGNNKKLLQLAKKNAGIILFEEQIKIENKQKKQNKGIENLKELLGISTLNRIESFDVSNTNGILNVSSMIVYIDGKPNFNLFRKFRLNIKGADDYGCMKETISRRFQDKKLLPDLLLIDGGLGHIKAVQHELELLELNIPVAGMVKDDNHNTRGLIFNEKEISMEKNSIEFKLISEIQDKTHDFAINYHRKLRSKQMTKSQLDDIVGIGEIKRKALLQYFGSIDKIKNQKVEDLMVVKGISFEIAQNIFNYFNKKEE